MEQVKDLSLKTRLDLGSLYITVLDDMKIGGSSGLTRWKHEAMYTNIKTLHVLTRVEGSIEKKHETNKTI